MSNRKPTKKDIARWEKVSHVAEEIQDLLYDRKNIDEYEEAEIFGQLMGNLLHRTINGDYVEVGDDESGIEKANRILGFFLHELHGYADVRIDNDIPIKFNLCARIQEDK